MPRVDREWETDAKKLLLLFDALLVPRYGGDEYEAAHRVPVFLALDPRLKVGVMLGGGLFTGATFPLDIDASHFAPRVRAPVLMLNGRSDFQFPLETSQVPLFRMFRMPASDKRHVLFDSGHVPPRMEMIKEILDWLDRYFGPPRTT